ncbi:hypothetical protein ULMS_21940 [Patiriisocius marinistellae]|uniref:DUF2254 domain-containing protein n=1 Tax=Patiriisocius marinistellae TaxID=2494560 RepID=A0A5J4G222_9FLAO|nr:DUF2254 domain-containing protein [Patiriisocius marinistellae]GEQ86686.1 hypothetical protein ULMS_21940 [Patiriisocius marinistellae]
MIKIYNRTLSFFNTIESKIAFYPTLLALGGFLLSIFMMSLEEKGVSKMILETLPRLMLEDGDTALTVMSACVGGIISMMVFSFSMVMLLLSQASSNFSPRLLPGLISDKIHQVILGTYLATIIYFIFTLFSIEPDDEKYTLPGMSILLGILLTILCLGAFIYFIHNISQRIQINNILDDIYKQSKDRLESLIDIESNKADDLLNSFPKTKNWHSYTSKESGYFQNISFSNVIAFCEEEETKIYIAIPKGFFVLSKVPFIYSDKEISEEKLNKLLENINFSRGELVTDNYILAFKQITEIAVKAMSPGINDPGTAINAIDYLTELFSLRMLKKDTGVIVKDEKVYAKIAVVSFEELLYYSMASLRTYCKHDPIIVQKLLWMLGYLLEQDAEEKAYFEIINAEIFALKEDAKTAFSNERDFQAIMNLPLQN